MLFCTTLSCETMHSQKLLRDYLISKMNNVLCFTDGLVSYNAPAGEQMSLPAFPVYVNDSVYDGAVIHRCVCAPFFHTSLHCFITALILRQYFLLHLVVASSPWRRQRQAVVSGSWWFTVRQYLMGMTESTTLMKFKNRNEPISLLLTVVFGLWHGE